MAALPCTGSRPGLEDESAFPRPGYHQDSLSRVVQGANALKLWEAGGGPAWETRPLGPPGDRPGDLGRHWARHRRRHLVSLVGSGMAGGGELGGLGGGGVGGGVGAWRGRQHLCSGAEREEDTSTSLFHSPPGSSRGVGSPSTPSPPRLRPGLWPPAQAWRRRAWARVEHTGSPLAGAGILAWPAAPGPLALLPQMPVCSSPALGSTRQRCLKGNLPNPRVFPCPQFYFLISVPRMNVDTADMQSNE